MLRYFLILISLFTGLMLYLGCRSTHTPVYHLSIMLGLEYPIHLFRNIMQSIHLADWVVYSLPDGLWMYSFVLSVLSIWNFKIDQSSRLWLYTAICVGLGFEGMQGFVKGLGVFDWHDLIFMIIGAVLAIRLCSTRMTIQ